MARRREESWGESDSPRPRRVAELIRRELAQTLQNIAAETGLGMVTLSSVDVSPDLRECKLYVTQLGPSVTHEAVVIKLQPYVRELRARIGKNLRLRYLPRLSFRFDESIEQGARIDALLSEIGSTQGTTSENDSEPK